LHTNNPIIPNHEYVWAPGGDPSTGDQIDAFFHSADMERLKRRMCDIGRRLWQKDFVDGNGGNLSVRVGDELVLCTPTMISKGFMDPEDLCLVTFDGRQVAGRRPRTSEISTHLAVMRSQPQAKACVHAHPPHATAYAIVAGSPPPAVLTEALIFLGELGIADYHAPGSTGIAEAVSRLSQAHSCVLMKNHGVMTWSRELEDAYWKVEIVDAYCRTAWIAGQLGRPVRVFTAAEQEELRAIRRRLNMSET
jgi:L-fuculose-phosphate aldolase